MKFLFACLALTVCSSLALAADSKSMAPNNGARSVNPAADEQAALDKAKEERENKRAKMETVREKNERVAQKQKRRIKKQKKKTK